MKRIFYPLFVLCGIVAVGVCLYPYPTIFDLVRDVSLLKDGFVLVRYYNPKGGIDAVVDENRCLFSAATNVIVESSCPLVFLGEDNKEYHRECGMLYVVPRCMSWLPLNIITLAERGIYLEYCPFNEVVYLSDDCARLGYDYTMGFCISNVPPRAMGVDIDQLQRNIQNIGDTTDAWKYKGYYRHGK